MAHNLKKAEEQKEEEELEAYLKERNATLGEETKSLRDSKEDEAMEQYMRLRSKAYGDSVQPSNTYKGKHNDEDEDLHNYLAERNKTLNEELTTGEDEGPDLEAYMRERREILGDDSVKTK